jgi:hypothetical protein
VLKAIAASTRCTATPTCEAHLKLRRYVVGNGGGGEDLLALKQRDAIDGAGRANVQHARTKRIEQLGIGRLSESKIKHLHCIPD